MACKTSTMLGRTLRSIPSWAMKTFLAILAAFALQPCAFAGLETDISSTNQIILKSGSWTPTPDQTRKALVSVQAFLSRPATTNDDRLHEMKKILANRRNYRVQFIGMIRGGRKMIWCNFFPAASEGKDAFQYWRTQPVVVDDGGFYYWQIEYDPATDKCSEFVSNGYAGSGYREDKNSVSQFPSAPMSSALVTTGATSLGPLLPRAALAARVRASEPSSPRKGIEEAERHNLYEMQKYQQRVLHDMQSPSPSLPLTTRPTVLEWENSK